ncbi:TIGR03617 family F420-dependent LLM class oxidoreductase [Mycobacterium sp. DL592]|uniref:TIGR03617 family F420-dependent LLM class oxidoreductase n=1 Tax=Mycobacterium sp. DL592 TaxID=2675524 RepID=UPI00141FDED5|nr:TIGR03617 family F420-dependent LLM class oxidoreductase [Mycobacterium sp. DL592]
MKVYAGMDPRLPLRDVAGYARRVEQLGFDGLHIAETIHDSLAVALLALEHTAAITVRTSITLAFVRSPTLVAYTAWDLAVMSGGRFELGLGSQIKQNVRDRYGMPWSEPRSRMRDYLGALEALFTAFRTGGRLDFQGQCYQLTRLQPYFNPGPDDAVAPPPIWLGAVNAGMCELAGELALGVVTHSTNSDPGYLRDVVRPALDRGAATAKRAAAPAIIASCAMATGAGDAAVARARERQRGLLAFLYSTPAYAPALERLGLTDLAGRLRAVVKDQRWSELPAVLTDAVLDTLLVSGRYDELPAILRARYGELADGVQLPQIADPGDDEALRACIAALQAR